LKNESQKLFWNQRITNSRPAFIDENGGGPECPLRQQRRQTGMVVKGGGYGLIGDIVVGIVGALIAGWLLPRFGIVIGGGIIAAIINAFIGAVILLIVLRLVKRAA
jgi:uncharacterized membrane protein YeaQ/YmgE (transglycosylase-associated protein family)